MDEVPLLMEFQAKMGVPEILDEVIKPHGNRKCSIARYSAEYPTIGDHSLERK